MAESYAQFFTGEDGQFYFRVKSANGEIQATSEGYSSMSNARRGLKDLLGTMTASEGETEETDTEG